MYLHAHSANRTVLTSAPKPLHRPSPTMSDGLYKDKLVEDGMDVPHHQSPNPLPTQLPQLLYLQRCLPLPLQPPPLPRDPRCSKSRSLPRLSSPMAGKPPPPLSPLSTKKTSRRACKTLSTLPPALPMRPPILKRLRLPRPSTPHKPPSLTRLSPLSEKSRIPILFRGTSSTLVVRLSFPSRLPFLC